MAKIQRVKAYTYKDHNVYKYRLNIPSDELEKLGWKEGTEVEIKAKNKKLEITKSKLWPHNVYIIMTPYSKCWKIETEKNVEENF